MQWEYIAKHWSYFETKVKRNWDRLSDSEVREIAGDRDRLVAKIMERYGCSREKAEDEVGDFSKWIVGKGVTRNEIR